MKALKLDYQASSRQTRPILLALSVLVAVLMTSEYRSLLQQNDERSNALQQLQAKHGVKPDYSKNALRLTAEMKQIQDNILARLHLPWEALFTSLENAQDKKVALLAIEPNIKTGAVQLTAETHSLQQALVYLEKLQQQAALQEVTLIEHEIAVDSAEQAVRFRLNLVWKNK